VKVITAIFTILSGGFVFENILLFADEEKGDIKIGNPYVEGAKVIVNIVEHGRSEKVRVVKYKRKVRYKRVFGHKQPFTKIKITDIAS